MRLILCAKCGQRIQVTDHTGYWEGRGQRQIQLRHPETAIICLLSGCRYTFPSIFPPDPVRIANRFPERYRTATALEEVFGPLS